MLLVLNRQGSDQNSSRRALACSASARRRIIRSCSPISEAHGVLGCTPRSSAGILSQCSSPIRRTRCPAGVPRRPRSRASRRLPRRRGGVSQAPRNRSGALLRESSGRASLIGHLTKSIYFRLDVRIVERPLAVEGGLQNHLKALERGHLLGRRCDLVLQPDLACCSNVHQVEHARTASGCRCRAWIHPAQCNGSIRGLSICQQVRSQARRVPKQATPRVLSRSPAAVVSFERFSL